MEAKHEPMKSQAYYVEALAQALEKEKFELACSIVPLIQAERMDEMFFHTANQGQYKQMSWLMDNAKISIDTLMNVYGSAILNKNSEITDLFKEKPEILQTLNQHVQSQLENYKSASKNEAAASKQGFFANDAAHSNLLEIAAFIASAAATAYTEPPNDDCPGVYFVTDEEEQPDPTSPTTTPPR